MRRVLSIGGSESAGRAGVAVDLRAFAAHGVHGCVALSAVTAQPGGSLGVGPKLLRAQIEAAMPFQAAKAGLLLSLPQAAAIGEALEAAGVPLVFDPVQQSSTGADLVDADEWRRLVDCLLPRSELFMPNLDEAGLLLGRGVEPTDQAMKEAGEAILDLGAKAVLLKGGHRGDAAVDWLCAEWGAEALESERVPGEFRGTGCLLSASVAALIARGRSVRDAAAEAKEFLAEAIRNAADAGSDQPHAFFEYYGPEGLPSRA